MRFDASTLEGLSTQIRTAPIPADQKELSELVPWRAWTHSPLFHQLLQDEGPFSLISCPRGKSYPPDWVLTSQHRHIGIEVTRIATERQEMAYYSYGRTIFDTPGLLTTRIPDAAFRERLARIVKGQTELGDLDEDSEENWDQVFLDVATSRLEKKYADSERYREHYSGCILLLWDRMFTTAPSFAPRYKLLQHYLTTAPHNIFSAVLITDGSVGDAEGTIRIR